MTHFAKVQNIFYSYIFCSSIQTKLWICAPNKNGPIEISLYFAYNIPFELEKKPLKRLLKRNFTIKILPSINVTASYVNACLYDNKKSQGLVVKVSNTSLEIGKSLFDNAPNLVRYTFFVKSQYS